MKKNKCIIIVLLMLAKSFAVSAQEFVVQGSWKLSFEDNKEFSKSNFKDSAWADLPVLKWSDDRKTTANRLLWIRKTVVIPSSLKAAFEKTGLLALSMGKIAQTDDTWLNGKFIGATGSGDTYRNYLVNKDDILWDQENTIAIRVKHWGSFNISIIPKFIAAQPSHFFMYGATLKNTVAKLPIINQPLVYQFEVTNKSPKTADGVVTANFFNFEGEQIFTKTIPVTLSVGKNNIEFPFQSTTPFLKIVYALSIPQYQYQQEWNAEYGYGNIAYKKITAAVNYKAPQKYVPAQIGKQIVGGYLGERVKANTEQRLYNVDEDALLAGFINRPGSHSWIGEHVGKFLEAACNAYASSPDPKLKIQIDRSAQQLIAAQLKDGYLGTYEMDGHWTSWDVWSHRYDLMGLLKYYELSGFKPALTASEKIGNLIMQTFGNEKGQKDIIRSGAHVGMAATSILESMGELYRFSGNKKYLDYCYFVVKCFNNPGGPRIISTLDSLGRVDKVANAKAYEMLSNLLGVVKLYRLTNDEQFLKPVLAAWNDIVQNRLYITGTTSSFEHFQDDQFLPAENNTNMGEGCVTTTWIQLSYQLLSITGEMKFINELERSVYNHLAGAENPQSGCVSYYTPLMGVKPYRCVITCCMSSVPRALAMIPMFVNGQINNKPSFLFYQPGTYSTTLANQSTVSFVTNTNFLNDGKVDIVVDKTTASPFAVDFRKPYWASDFTISINGIKQAVNTNDMVDIKRVWKKGDRVHIDFNMPIIVLDGGKSYPGQVAFQRGPQVLAFDKNINGFSADDITVSGSNIQLQSVPATLPKNWIGGEAFQLKSLQNNLDKNIILVPYADASQTGGAMSTWLKKTK